jgi:hypothetical protein
MALREAHSLLGFKTIETKLGSWIGTNALRQSGHHRQDHAGQVLRPGTMVQDCSVTRE